MTTAWEREVPPRITVGEIRNRHRMGPGMTAANYGGNDVSGYPPLRVPAVPRRVARDAVIDNADAQWWAEAGARTAWYLCDRGRFHLRGWDGGPAPTRGQR